ncbi:C-type lectin 37Db-like [Aedes albopictus]|uniref:C-type lectin domain-containing protein n=1 Tax=Aedes albopictus TaxID=7160 RepID=A0ABM1XZ78_AEDAL|nr:C-type lectin 37Db-like [Aedes albopictus]XP_029714393.1 C-type lectin 37Db-like [Aedes albopictus]XP_029731695.1 C-type lectin 37Db-like [Aedes albopictus]
MIFSLYLIVTIFLADLTAAQQECDCKNRFCFPNVVANWVGAAEYCSRNGWRLAILDTEEKQQQMEEQAQKVDAFKTNKVELWIGASDLAKEGKFVWHGTGMDVSYEKWIAGMPDNRNGNEHCVHLWYEPSRSFQWQWNDVVCSSTRRFVCEQM